MLRFLPPRLRGSVWSRFYRPTPAAYLSLYESAPLAFARGVSMRLVPGDVISDSIALTGFYELALTRAVCRLARRSGYMVDVGANLGYFSLLWAAGHAENRVTAFEPSPRNLPLLRHNVTANHLADRIDVRSSAVGEVAAELDFDLGPSDQTGWGGFTLAPSGRSCRVPVVRLDDALPDLDDIELLKIDIEGADTWALLGAERLLRERRVRHIWWEQHKPRMLELGIPENQAAEFVRECGYRVESDGKGESREWHATRA